MASYSDLVDVSFQDYTAHQSVDGKDVLGVYMPFHWGPVDKLRVYNRTQFYEAYPESLPVGKKLSDAPEGLYASYAQVKKFFENGGSFVEVYRPILDNKYQGIQKGDYKVVLKYPGTIPAALLPTGTTNVYLDVTDTLVRIVAFDGTATTVLESWNGQFLNPSELVEGRYTHFTKVLESSQFLACMSTVTAFSQMTESTADILGEEVDCYEVSFDLGEEGITAESEGTTFSGIFSDIENSDATLLISPTLDTTFDSIVSNVSKQAKTSCAVIGYPVAGIWDSVSEPFQSLTDKFTLPLVGRELVTVFGENMLLNCTGGYCGALSNIANTVRLNQIASAKTYGSYVGVLDKTMNFSEVLSLHEKGITSVYSSKTGPQLFGVHNAYYKSAPNSYFSKSNVSRVVAHILRNVFPICFEAIHTDTASNPISRAVFESRCNSVISDMIAQQNLQSDSRADASAEVNTDYLTKGGKELNLILVLHFVGLVERVKIKVVATDSSVNAEII